MIGYQAALALGDIAAPPLLVVDPQGIVVHANAGMTHMLGLSIGDLQGNPLVQFVNDDKGRLPGLLRRFSGSGEWLVGPLTLRGAAGPVDFPCRGKVLQRPQGDEPKLLIIMHNRQAEFTLLNRKIKELQTEVRRRQETEHQLRQSEQKFSTAFSSCPVAASIAEARDGRIIEANANYERDFGWSKADLVGRTAVEIGLWPDGATREAWGAMLHRDGRVVDYETVWMHKNGQHRTISLSGEITELGGKSCILAYATDITARKEAEAELRVAATAFESTASVLVTDANRVILRINKALTADMGFTAEETIGKTPRMFSSGRHSPEFYRSMWKTIHRTGGWQGEIWDRHKNGREHPKWVTISAVKDGGGSVSHYIGTLNDITERKKAEEKINELAFFDQLTGLPNRTLLLNRLRHAITASARTHSYGALLLIDLDNFKSLNDTLGHDMGDLLLKQVALRLSACVRAGDTVARLGGDEFVVMLANLNTSETDAATQAETVGEKILAELNQTYHLKDIDHHSTPSIGITLFADHQCEIDVVLKQADLAMYRSKAAGRNALCFFDADMEVVVTQRAALEKDLRQAIQEQQFTLHYQPQFAGGQVTGSEALARWQHPVRGVVLPDEFIPLAEETGLILPLGHWVLETACTQLATWATCPEMSHLTISVNVSVRQFHQADFVERLLALLKSTGANPQRLKLELTESLLISNVEMVVEKMFALKDKGVGFSLDDFGTGYSSLAYLKRLPLNQLKIDQSFVRDVLSDPNDATIARTIIALSQNLGLGVIAEGVETPAQRDFLASAGCHAYQGYFFSRPLPITQFEEFVRQVEV